MANWPSKNPGKPFDLIITDIRMPGMDGLEVIRRIKSYDKSIEIIILTGYATLENAVEALSNGAFHFVLKPLHDIDSFYHIIAQALEKRSLFLQNQQLMKQLESANQNLEAQVKEKTASLEERVKELEALKQELSTALQKAEVANHAKSEFLGIMSHELKTPLNIILGNVDILLIQDHEKELRDYLEVIKKTSISFSEIIDDLLLFSGIDHEQKNELAEHFNIREVIDGIQQILTQRASDKNLPFYIEIDPNIPFNLLGKWRLMRQVVYNLCGNAIKFTHSGECRLAIKAVVPKAVVPNDETVSRKKGPVTLLFEISDTGIGIPENKKDIIFNYCTQADQSMTRSYGGVGMGLAICKKLADILDGKIWCESKENEGSRFSFS
ncbi:MAG: histidine kinase [Candidatus Magnetoglobus multicellularis str. Araruama]|uniref:histidine kinase n=1 Tax=Candidatus Magnetoglobus multicellularis str. Araruama TaxID=890399 RepID=A0A1V1P9V5_9BACT|nr:MAG: histidine kinase [Candidatus Magnetoglobus multicellularis str. Araruama]